MDKKLVVASVILLCVLANSIPSINGNYCEMDGKKNSNQQKNIRSQYDVVLTCYSLGLSERSINEIMLPSCIVNELFEKIAGYTVNLSCDPQSEETKKLEQDIVNLIDDQNLASTEILNEVFQLNPPMFIPSQHRSMYPLSIVNNKASVFFCNFATTGTGSQFPIIILPRLLPLLLLPIPRVFLRWSAEEGITSCGGLLSGKGFIANGQQKGVALGFWGVGFSVFLPPIMQYGFIGYALFASVSSDDIEFCPPNNPPLISPVNPSDGEMDVSTSLSELSFSIEDQDRDLMSYSVTTDPDIGSGNGTLKPDGIYTVPITGLEGSTEYSWHSEVSDGKDTTMNTFTFTTEPAAPVVSNPVPYNGEKYVPFDLSQLVFHLKDFQGELMDYTVVTCPNIGSGSGSGIGNGVYTVDVSGLEYNTEYTWFLNVTDGTYWTRETFIFRTEHKMIFNPFNEGWQFRKEITIDHSLVEEDLESFPILLSTVDTDIRDKAQFDGDDILFMDDIGIANRLYHEIEFYDSLTGEIVVWINIPSLGAEDNTSFYLYYGNPLCDNQQSPELVWDSHYVGVYHLGESSGVTCHDSTLNGNHGTYQGTLPRQVEVKIDMGQNFYSSDDYIILPSGTHVDVVGTVEMWVQQYEVDTTMVYYCDWYSSEWYTALQGYRTGRYNFVGTYNGELQWDIYPPLPNIDTNLHYVASAWQPDDATLIRDGFSIGNDSSCSSNCYEHNSILLGDSWYGTSDLIGNMDEVRFSAIRRSNSWISTSYINQDDPSNFLDIGLEEQNH
jgi:hypothetical protein